MSESGRVSVAVRYRAGHLLGLGGATALIVVLAALVLAGHAHADCGGPESAEPSHHVRGELPPLVIGDSTMLLSLDQLAREGYDAEAQGCRQFPAALALLSARKAQGTLPHIVVIALGANGSVTPNDVGVALGLLCCTRLLVLVTPRELGGGSGSDAVVERQEAKRYRSRTLLLDWVQYSEGHPEWFQPDGLHLTTPGASAFARLLARALPYAQPKPKPKGKPKPERKPKPSHKPRASHKLTPAVRLANRDVGGQATSAGASPAAGPTSPSTLTIRVSAAHIGYVAADIRGPPGTRVQLGEVSGHATRPIEVIDLGTGITRESRALTWRCDQRVRELEVRTLPPAVAQFASAAVKTPSCSRRLATNVNRAAAVGGTLTIGLRDRWGIGGLPLTICVSPPGGGVTCGHWGLQTGQRSRVIRIDTPRPGGWLVTVKTGYQKATQTLVWAAHPGGRIRLLAAGDSEMQLLDDFLGQDLQSHGVAVSSDARISTGLTNSFFFDWPSHAFQEAASLRPDVTVIFMGANDGFAVRGANGQLVSCCGPGWSAGYATLVERMMTAYLRGNAGRVYWFTLPTPRAGNFQSVFNGVNAGIRLAAKRFPGRVGLIDANAFFTPGNRYRDFMTYQGRGFVIHESDGVHLSVASDTVAATLVVHQMLADHIIR
jgi:lysophospholipase L1-like esterase